MPSSIGDSLSISLLAHGKAPLAPEPNFFNGINGNYDKIDEYVLESQSNDQKANLVACLTILDHVSAADKTIKQQHKGQIIEKRDSIHKKILATS